MVHDCHLFYGWKSAYRVTVYKQARSNLTLFCRHSLHAGLHLGRIQACGSVHVAKGLYLSDLLYEVRLRRSLDKRDAGIRYINNLQRREREADTQ